MTDVMIRWRLNAKVHNKRGILLDTMPEATHCEACGHTNKPGPQNLRVKIDDTVYLIPMKFIREIA